MIRNFLLNDSEDEELKEIIRTFPGESSNRAQEPNEKLFIEQQGLQIRAQAEQQEQEEQFQKEEGYYRKEQQEQDRLRGEQQEEETLHKEEEGLRREYQEEKLRREQCEEDEKLRREQQREEEERLHRQHQEETLRREQQEEERQRKERQLEVRLSKEQQEEKFHKEHLDNKLWWEQETEKQWDQQKYHRDLHDERVFYNDTMQAHVDPELLSVRQIKEDIDEGKDISQTLPVLPPVWGCPPLVPPPSPSRPKSPWGKLDPYDSSEEDREYVGFATLPNQVHRKYVKKGFEFTLMVAGESGLGKSTLINSLFLTDLYRGRQLPSPEERVTQTVEIVKQTVDIEEKGVRLRLTVVDTPGFGDAINNEECWKPVADYIDQQFEQYFRDESGLNRKNLQDTRVHCCLYFLSPLGHGLRPLDVEFLQALQDRVNIVPILGKADTLTPKELIQQKQKLREELDYFGIRIYQFPDCDSDQDEDFKIQDMELKKSIPFAVIGSNTIVEVNGKRVRGRLYPWGVVEVENEKHCDFVKLRTMLIRTHMQDLKDVTRETHYENYRAQCIQSLTQRVVRERNRNKLTRESGTDFPIPSVPPSPDHETMRLIREKDEELRRMQEVLQKMQRQMNESH
ncbi:PREDICTED: septin-4-like [Nanorana parkeri]|uniref:septin-4-like n=1 Tax=Nanorana parkeri TaxID=125878 RepID=UPI000854A5E6|nr:PREDICTED: septin-4-like [Nanorana parkeri]